MMVRHYQRVALILIVNLLYLSISLNASADTERNHPERHETVAAVTVIPAPITPVVAPGDTTEQHPYVLNLKYLKPDQARALLVAVVPDNSPDIRLIADPVNNRLVLVGSDDVYQKVKDLLAQLDVPPKQVMFETQIVELDRDDVNDVGIDWGPTTALPSAAPTDPTSTFQIALGIPNNPQYNVNLQATINHLISINRGRLLASPRIATLDGVTAHILIGQKLAVESTNISNGTTLTSVQYIDVGIKLEVTPTVNEDGIITTHIVPEVSNESSVTAAGDPNITTRQADTTVRVRDGETIVLGGLIQRQVTATTLKTPILGDLPLIGMFFRSSDKEITETELIIMLTPKIIYGPKGDS